MVSSLVGHVAMPIASLDLTEVNVAKIVRTGHGIESRFCDQTQALKVFEDA